MVAKKGKGSGEGEDTEPINLAAERAKRKASKPESQAEALVGIGRQVPLFRSSDGETYADITFDDGHRETHKIKSAGFTRYLRREFYKRRGGQVPTSNALTAARDLIEAFAAEGPIVDVFVRVGRHHAKVYVDLGDKTWEAIEIDAEGWRTLTQPPLRFIRHPGQLPLPRPIVTRPRGVMREPGDDIGKNPIEDLRRFLNLKRDSDFDLIVAFMIGAIGLPDHYPALAFVGEQDSAKSTAMKVIRQILDPNTAPLRRLPRKDDDLMISATKSHVQCFDNISSMSADTSDDLCRLTDGAGTGKRTLFTDDDEKLLSAARPILLNGISTFVTRGDLASRTYIIELAPITDEQRRSEEDLWSDFDSTAPAMLGGLLDAVSTGLSGLADAKEALKSKLARRADFLILAVAAETSWTRAGSVKAAFDANTAATNLAVADNDLIASAIRTFVRERNYAAWEGSMTIFHTELTVVAGPAAKSEE